MNKLAVLKKVVFSFLIPISSFLILFASCEDLFQDKIPHPGKNDSLDSLFPVNDEITKLSSPQQFYIAPYYSSTEIRLTWNEVRGAAYYMIERAQALSTEGEPDEGDYETLDRFVYGTSFVDTIIRTASLDAVEYQNKYFYRVSAFNPVKKYDESDPCPPQSAMLFRPPGGLKASGGASVDYVQLEWEKTSGASSYEIFRSDFPNGDPATSLGTVLGNNNWFRNRVIANDQGKDFYYMITAQNSFGNKTVQTRPAYGYAKVAGAPDMPSWVNIKEGFGRGDTNNSITIQWEESLDAEYYAVYRYSSVDSSLTRLTDHWDTTEFTDSGLRAGFFYYYKVQGIINDISSGKELKSQFSDSDPEGFVLSPPETVIAEKSQTGDSVKVKWLPALGNESERMQYTYNVYTDTRQDGDFTNVVQSGVSPSVDGEGYISAEGIDVSNTFFKVSTVKGIIESGLSPVVSPAPAAANIIDVTRYELIQGEAANSSGVYPVKITWKKPENETPAFYHVQRSTRSGAGFSRVNDAALGRDGPWTDVFYYDHSTETYTYIDRNDTARTGKKFYYRVLSLNQLEQGNFPSDERIGWGALTHNQYMLEYNRTMTAALKKLTYMHKPGSTEKLGTETKNGALGGTIYYNAAISGLGARIIIQLTNYAEFYIENDPANGVYFTLSGNSNTSANMSSNGSMDGTVTAVGMYPGSVKYDGIEIKGGAAGGGYYVVTPEGFSSGNVPYNLPGL